jgi:hypothetical protein
MSIVSTFGSSSTPFRSPLLPFSLPTQPINTGVERLPGTPIHFEQGAYPPSLTHRYPTQLHPFHFPPPIFLPVSVSQSSNFNVQRSPSRSEPFEASAKNGPTLRLLPIIFVPIRAIRGSPSFCQSQSLNVRSSTFPPFPSPPSLVPPLRLLPLRASACHSWSPSSCPQFFCQSQSPNVQSSPLLQ